MEFNYAEEEQERVVGCRESFNCRVMGTRLFDEVMAFTHILESEVQGKGSFKDKLEVCAFALAKTQRFDAGKAERIIREAFKDRTGVTLNQMREALQAREDKLTKAQHEEIADYTADIEPMMADGVKICFNRTVSHQARIAAAEYGITDAAARRIMAEGFKAGNDQDFYDWGSGLDKTYFDPQIEAEMAKAQKKQSQGRNTKRQKASTKAHRSSARSMEIR